MGEEISGQMEEYGSCETKRIDAIHHASVPGNKRPVVLQSPVSLDRGHDDAATKSSKTDYQSH